MAYFDFYLGHELSDVRRRALLNLISKLQLGTLEIGALSHDKDLFINLLQWFNIEDEMHIDVLHLLIQLVQVHFCPLEEIDV